MTLKTKIAIGLLTAGCFYLLSAQRGGGASETWWTHKTEGGVYKTPMRPRWKLSDLKNMHAGEDSWSEQIILDPEQDVTYNSGAPGSEYSRRLHPDTHTLFVVIAGQVTFDVEGHEPVAAKRGSLVNILKSTVFSYAVTGEENALWVEVNPTNYKTAYPSDDPAPEAIPGGDVVKISFNHTPPAYPEGNQPHWNLFDAVETCDIGGARVNVDGVFANPIYGFANEGDPLNNCPQARVRPTPSGDFDPESTFGHMHAGPAEWWIVQVGGIQGRFENAGEFHAVEGDVLYAAPMTWHQMGFKGSGPSCRLAMGGYRLINMGNTAGQ